MVIVPGQLHLHRHGGGISSNLATSMHDLPEDVILSIMTKLNLREAVNFSLVSKQWTHIPSCVETIVFGGQMAKKGIQMCPGHKDSFIKGVDQFLQHYIKRRRLVTLPPSPDCFVIFFCLSRDSTADIDRWINMAVQNGFKNLIIRLECNVHPKAKTDINYDEQYIFPWQLLDQSSTVVTRLFLRSCFLGCSLASKVHSLEILEVCDTVVTEGDMDRISQYCPTLRKMVLSCCRVPAKLALASGSLACVLILNCLGLEEIEVLSGRALTEFTYKGRCVTFNIISASKLTNLTFRMHDAEGVNYVFRNLLRDFPAMRSLSIFRDHEIPPSLSHLHGRITSFLQLEELKLYFNPASSFSLATMKEILKACPVLRRLEIVPPCTLDDVEKGPVQHLHKCLRFIKIRGFCGGKGCIDLAKLLVQVPEALQHVLIEQKVKVAGYFWSEHSETWHGEQVAGAVKHILIKLMRSGQLTFT